MQGLDWRNVGMALVAMAAVACSSTGSSGEEESGDSAPRFETAASFQAIEVSTDALCSTGAVTGTVAGAGALVGYPFAAVEGQLVAVEGQASGLAASLALYGPKKVNGMYGTGQALVYSGPAGSNPRIEWTIQKSGVFLAVIGNTSGAGAVELTLTVNGAAGCASSADCDDGDACTLDTESADGCLHQPVPGCGDACTADADCDDGNPCTDTPCIDAPGGGKVCGSSPTACDDEDACTEDACVSGVGCVFTPLATPECALAGGCATAADCEDGDPCTVDDCLGEKCSNALSSAAECQPVDCNDGDPCTADSQGPGGDCVHAPIAGCGVECTSTADCDDGDACTADACSPVTSTCVYESEVCIDGDPCTLDACSPEFGCAFPPSGALECAGECVTAADCADGDACTVDSCVDGACVHAPSLAPECQPVVCDDGNPCTTDSESADGCTHEAISGCAVLPCASLAECDDKNACTTDSCTGSAPAPGYCVNTLIACDDGNDCTIDTCSMNKGCIFASQPGGCEDGNSCTSGDFCVQGACQPGQDTCGTAGLLACALSGAVGEERVCPVRVASKSTKAGDMAAALQLTVAFDESAVELVDVVDNVCFAGAGCFDLPVMGVEGAQPLSTGHSVSSAPQQLSGWNAEGFGAMVIVNLSDPAVLLSQATVTATNQLSGDPSILRMRFKLKKTIGSGAPIPVYFDQIVAANGQSLSLKLAAIGETLGVIVTEP